MKAIIQKAITHRNAMREHWGKGICGRSQDRSREQRDFDAGVIAAAELCRRITGNEDLAYALIAMCSCGLLEEEAK